jgi:hypothetical protein
MTQQELRKAEAERIAKAEGFPIVDAAPDWYDFMLDDPLPTKNGTLRTAFTWEAGRFEGFVTYAEPSK